MKLNVFKFNVNLNEPNHRNNHRQQHNHHQQQQINKINIDFDILTF